MIPTSRMIFPSYAFNNHPNSFDYLLIMYALSAFVTIAGEGEQDPGYSAGGD